MRSMHLWVWALTAIASVGDESVGMNIHHGEPAFIDACADLGVRWVRMDANWLDLEPADDMYNWAVLDGAVDRAVGAGLDVFLTLAYTPGWVPRHGNTDSYTGNDVPDDAATWSSFVSAAVTHYRARGVRHFGLWNEANLRGFFEGTAGEYVTVIVLPGAAAVRAACNDCFVLGPELANVGDADDYLEAVLSMAGTGAFDIITHHSYNGFAETGWTIWSGDSYINMLDQQRFPFTRRSIRQILDAAGWSGEVWMTETGYRASPPGDMGEENLQAIYVRRVLEEQLSRAWYTNTFFYEMHDCGPDQPGCTIDGFGLMRWNGTNPGMRAFPADFRQKPAFGALRDFIDQNPAIVGAQPPKQCGDGIDNDQDGRVDGQDRGCSGAQDDDEADDPPRSELSAEGGGAILDGDLSEYGSWISLAPDSWRGTEPLGADDLEVGAAARWDSTNLYFAFQVTDDQHDNNHVPSELWQGDSVQLAFDVGGQGGSGYDAIDDHELNFALVGSTPTSFRFQGPAGASNDFEARIDRDQVARRTRYEVRIGAGALPGVQLSVGTRLRFSFLVNDADGAGRIGWREWTAGIGTTKEPEVFGELVFLPGGPPPIDAGPVDASMPPADSGLPSVDAGERDAGIIADTGSSGEPDAAVTAPDAMINTDADAGTTITNAGDEGCSCSAERATSSAAWLAAAALFFTMRRRRDRAG